MPHPNTVTKVTSIPPCDFSADHGDAFADAKLPHLGPWANVCWPCFTAHECKLGLGKGQMFVTDATELKVMPETKAELHSAFGIAKPAPIIEEVTS